MPPFYPYITSTLQTSTPISTLVFHAAQIAATPLPTLHPAQAGTSLSTPAIIAIMIAILFLFVGIMWFAYHALVTLPRRKKVEVDARKRKKRVETRERREI
jgi:protein-S-isoprenylcysteine O-methyltransferase Ste14